LRIQLRCTKPSLSVFPNHAAERCSRFSWDMDLSIPSVSQSVVRFDGYAFEDIPSERNKTPKC
jgi:hypothetical protein